MNDKWPFLVMVAIGAIATDYCFQSVLMPVPEVYEGFGSEFVMWSLKNDIFTFVVSLLTAIAAFAVAAMLPMREKPIIGQICLYTPIVLILLWFSALIFYAIRDEKGEVDYKGRSYPGHRFHHKLRDIDRAVYYIIGSVVAVYFQYYKSAERPASEAVPASDEASKSKSASKSKEASTPASTPAPDSAPIAAENNN